MTDEQIIKALERCTDKAKGCKKCPYIIVGCIGDLEENKMLKDVLDLINRKDAYIADLKKANAEMFDKARELYKRIEKLERELISADEVIGFREAEIERLQEVTTNTVNSSIRFGLDKEQEIRKAKSEAYKEFAEMVFENTCVYEFENKAEGYTEGVVDTMDFYIVKINDTLTKLTEGGNEDGTNHS